MKIVCNNNNEIIIMKCNNNNNIINMKIVMKIK